MHVFRYRTLVAFSGVTEASQTQTSGWFGSLEASCSKQPAGAVIVEIHGPLNAHLEQVGGGKLGAERRWNPDHAFAWRIIKAGLMPLSKLFLEVR